MNGNEILLDIINENEKTVQYLVKEIPIDCWYWKPDSGANTIAITLWHSTRALDVFLTQHVLGQDAKTEYWHTSGFATQTMYDPHGIGTNGWGQLTGYTLEEVAEIPEMYPSLLLEYFTVVITALKTYIKNTPMGEIQQPAPGYDGKFNSYFWIRHPLLDLTRHLGEIMAIHAYWQRIQENV